MSILVSYENNEALRKRYFELNNITHVEVWPEGDQFQVYLSSGTPGGFKEGPPHPTFDRAADWARRYAPGLGIENGAEL